MKKHISSKKRFMISTGFIIGAIILLVCGTLAIYTSQDHQRSVVRNRDNEVIRFSSDKLYRVTLGTPPQKYYYPTGKEERTMSFQVCNYDQSKSTLFNERQIDYTITFEVKNGTGGFDYKITDGKTRKTVTTGNTVEFSNSLTGGRKSTDSYSVTFGEEDFQKLEVIVTVTPVNSIMTQNRILNGVLTPIEYASTQGVTIKWEYTDSNRGTPKELDAYNVSVSISGGARNVLIKWDHTKLDIDPFFAKDKTINKDGIYSTITVPMDSEDLTGSYLIQFYNHNTTKPDWTKWNQLPIDVTMVDIQ